MQITFRRVARRCAPFGGQAAERADVPGRDEEVSIELFGGHVGIKVRLERIKVCLNFWGAAGR